MLIAYMLAAKKYLLQISDLKINNQRFLSELRFYQGKIPSCQYVFWNTFCQGKVLLGIV